MDCIRDNIPESTFKFLIYNNDIAFLGYDMHT